MNVAITGCGEMGWAHTRAYLNNKVKIVAVCDVDEKRAKELAEYAGCNWYTDLKTMLDSEKVDGLSICTPPFDHIRAIETASAYKCSILCEKPFVADYSEVDKAVGIIRDNNITFRIGFKMRYESVYRAAIETVRSGTLGQVQFVVISHYQCIAPRAWKMSTGIVRELLVHACDMSCCLFDAFPKTVSLDSTSLLEQFGGDDRAVLQLGFGPGRKAVIIGGYIKGFTADMAGRNDFVFHVVGEKGHISGLRNNEVSLVMPGSVKTWRPSEEISAFDYEMDEFIQASAGKSDKGPSLREAIASQLILDYAYRSKEKGCEIETEVPGRYREIFANWAD